MNLKAPGSIIKTLYHSRGRDRQPPSVTLRTAASDLVVCGPLGTLYLFNPVTEKVQRDYIMPVRKPDEEAISSYLILPARVVAEIDGHLVNGAAVVLIERLPTFATIGCRVLTTTPDSSVPSSSVRLTISPIIN